MLHGDFLVFKPLFKAKDWCAWENDEIDTLILCEHLPGRLPTIPQRLHTSLVPIWSFVFIARQLVGSETATLLGYSLIQDFEAAVSVTREGVPVTWQSPNAE
jgi:hypothetical protein